MIRSNHNIIQMEYRSDLCMIWIEERWLERSKERSQAGAIQRTIQGAIPGAIQGAIQGAIHGAMQWIDGSITNVLGAIKVRHLVHQTDLGWQRSNLGRSGYLYTQIQFVWTLDSVVDHNERSDRKCIIKLYERIGLSIRSGFL